MTTSPLNIRADRHPYTSGSAAVDLSSVPTTPSGDVSPSTQRRPNLSVVSAPLKAAPKGFVLMSLGILIAALMVVLLTNIVVSNRQYDLLELNAHHSQLHQENEKLSLELATKSAPQNLASQAAEMGMVLPGQTASIDLKSGKITGKATPASKDNRPTNFVSKPTVASGHGIPGATPPQELDHEPVSVDNEPVPGPASDALGMESPQIAMPSDQPDATLNAPELKLP